MIDREEAIASLASDDTDARLRAARFFAKHATASDRRRLQAALRRETVPWTKRALERAVQRAGQSSEHSASAGAMDSGDLSRRQVVELRTAAVNEVAGTIIHELAPLVGSLGMAAPKDIENYGSSRTAVLLTSLGRLVQGIRNLKTAASPPQYEECDLEAVCREICLVHAEHAQFLFAGKGPFWVEMDPSLFDLALSNVVRNAIEAIPEAVAADRVITLNWGRAGKEIWMSVLDNGPGFENDPNAMVELGKTTKAGSHIGFGLGTAKQAMLMMDGDLYPANGADGGAMLELRWFIDDENPVR